MLTQVMEEFVRQFSGGPEIMARHLAEGDLAAIGREAHDLKGVAASIGATALGEKAASLQSAAGQGDLELVRTLGQEVCDLLTTVLVSCSRWLARPAQQQDSERLEERGLST